MESTQMTNAPALATMGFTIPTPAYLFGAILFSVIGYASYHYGKRNELMHPKWIGVALMLFPYAISQTWLLYLIGSGLCMALYTFRS